MILYGIVMMLIRLVFVLFLKSGRSWSSRAGGQTNAQFVSRVDQLAQPIRAPDTRKHQLSYEKPCLEI